MTIPLHQTSPQRHPQQEKMSKKTAMRDRLPAQVFTRGTTGAVTVKTHSTDGTNLGSSGSDERSRSTRPHTRDPPRERSPRPPRTRRRSSSARRNPDVRVNAHSLGSGDHDYRHQVTHPESSSDQGSAASPGSSSRGRHTPKHMDSRDSPSIQKPSPQKPGARDVSQELSLDSQKLHIKATKKVIDGTFQSRSRVNPLIAVDRCLR
jgi:hypothetical protein